MFIIIIAGVILITYVSLNFVRDFWILHCLKIPDYNEYPSFLGILYPIVKLAISSPENRFRIMADLCFKYPDMMKVWLGPKLVVFVNHPQRIQKVLLSQKCADKWKMFYGFMDRNSGLIAASTTVKWKEHRKFFNFSFSLPAIESFTPMFLNSSDDFCEALSKQEENIQFDLLPIAKKCSFDMLCTTMLDMKVSDLADDASCMNILNCFETTEKALNQKIEIPFLYPETIYKLTQLYRDENNAKQALNEFSQNIVKIRQSTIRTSERSVLIDHILQNQENFSVKETNDHVLTFLAGYETMSNAFSHVILLLAMHSEIQEKLFQAIQSSISSDDFKGNSVNSIEYLDFVIKEALRLMPTVPMVLREVKDDLEMEPGLVIPKGVHLVINFYALHRRKDVWGFDSDEFKPERFSSVNSDGRHIFSFLPFSSGNRGCIANKYSMVSLKITIAKLVRNFKFKTTMKMQDIILKSYISLKLCTSHLISIEKRIK